MSTDPRRYPNWWIAPVLGLVVIVTAVAALIVRGIYHQQAGTPSAGVGAPPGSSSMPSSAEPGPTTVAYAPDFANFPQHSQMLTVLQTYFDAINERRYDEWLSVVTAARAAEQPKQTFLHDFNSTRDGSIYLYRADGASDGGVLVLLGFTSTQAVADAPPDFPYPCIRWQIVLPLAWDQKAKQYEVDAGLAGKDPQRQRC